MNYLDDREVIMKSVTATTVNKKVERKDGVSKKLPVTIKQLYNLFRESYPYTVDKTWRIKDYVREGDNEVTYTLFKIN